MSTRRRLARSWRRLRRPGLGRLVVASLVLHLGAIAVSVWLVDVSWTPPPREPAPLIVDLPQAAPGRPLVRPETPTPEARPAAPPAVAARPAPAAPASRTPTAPLTSPAPSPPPPRRAPEPPPPEPTPIPTPPRVARVPESLPPVPKAEPVPAPARPVPVPEPPRASGPSPPVPTPPVARLPEPLRAPSVPAPRTPIPEPSPAPPLPPLVARIQPERASPPAPPAPPASESAAAKAAPAVPAPRPAPDLAPGAPLEPAAPAESPLAGRAFSLLGPQKLELPPLPGPKLPGGGGPRDEGEGAGEAGRVREGQVAIPLNTPDPRYSDYFLDIKRRIEANLVYPREAAQRDESGQLLLEFVVKKDGTLRFVELARSSGVEILDRYSLNTIKLAAPFPPIPDRMGVDSVFISASFNYILARGFRIFNLR